MQPNFKLKLQMETYNLQVKSLVSLNLYEDLLQKEIDRNIVKTGKFPWCLKIPRKFYKKEKFVLRECFGLRELVRKSTSTFFRFLRLLYNENRWMAWCYSFTCVDGGAGPPRHIGDSIICHELALWPWLYWLLLELHMRGWRVETLKVSGDSIIFLLRL